LLRCAGWLTRCWAAKRYLQALRQAAKAKTTEALAAWWNEALRCQDIAGPLWATLTHARCTSDLAQHVEGGVHMLQHQAGMAARIDFGRFQALLDENAVLARELGNAQRRSTRQSGENARHIEVQQSEMIRLRAEIVGRDTIVAVLQEDLRTLEAASPSLRSRLELAHECQWLVERNHEFQRLLLQSQQEAERHEAGGHQLPLGGVGAGQVADVVAHRLDVRSEERGAPGALRPGRRGRNLARLEERGEGNLGVDCDVLAAG